VILSQAPFMTPMPATTFRAAVGENFYFWLIGANHLLFFPDPFWLAMQLTISGDTDESAH
jgi:hypothetical protein